MLMTIEETILKAAQSVDDGWSVLALFIVCTAVLAWKFGGTLLELVELTKAGNQVAVEARDKAAEIGNSIKTNHGSKSLGDAVDRLTEEMWAVRAEQAEMRGILNEHLASSKQ